MPARPKVPVVLKCSMEGCDYTASHQRYLDEHVSRHMGLKRHQCPHPGCDYKALSKGHITRHMLTHTKEKPHHCTWKGCGQSFQQFAHLQTHTLKHTGERPFACPVHGCDYTSTRAYDVKRHQKTHDKQAAAGKEMAPSSGRASTIATMPRCHDADTTPAPAIRGGVGVATAAAADVNIM